MESHSDRAFQLIMRMAERMLDKNMAAYRQNITATIEYELIMMKREVRDGNEIAAKRHKVRAEVYQSILERI